MNQVGLSLAWLTIQATCALIPAAGIVLWAARRGPATGSWVAAMSLAMMIALSAAILMPRGLAPNDVPGLDRAETIDRGRIRNNPRASPTTSQTVSRALGGAGSSLSIAALRGMIVRWPRGSTINDGIWRRGAIGIACVFFAGWGLGLAHVIFGLWDVRRCVRRSTSVTNPELDRLLETTRVALGCARRVELRELPELSTPATAGWRRPVILLPVDWRSWSDAQRRAVLAHELAHIRRADYALGLLARFCVSLHFYHPGVRWLAGKLVEQQELAADALGARHAGGRETYLVALTELALRQPQRLTNGPARAFLPARGTLIRRIKMLQSVNGLADRSWSKAARWTATAALAAITLGISAMRAPVWAADDGPPAEARKQAAAGAPESKTPTNEPFDLSFLPEIVEGVVAIRPAAVLRRVGMAQYTDGMNKLLLEDMLREMGIPRENCPLRLQDIEQVTYAVTVTKLTPKKKGDPTRRLGTESAMIRTVKSFDWTEMLRNWPGGATEKHEAGQSYLALPKLPHAQAPLCAHVADSRTVVFGDEASLLRLFRRRAPANPAIARTAEWKRVENDLVATAIDNEKNALFRDHDASAVADAATKALFQQTDRWYFGLSDADDLLFQVIGVCGSDATPESVATAAERLLALYRPAEIQKTGGISRRDDDAARDPYAEILRNLRVAREKGAIVISPSKKVPLQKLVRDFIQSTKD
jgi:beta-lactamase regulating signal transducer with metallopeptidase domain